MKKLFVLLVIAAIFFSLVACSKSESDCYILDDGEVIEAYRNFVWSQSGEVCADYTHYENVFPENLDEIPIIKYSEDLEVIFDKSVTRKEFKLYNEEFERIEKVEELDDVNELLGGSYYMVLEVVTKDDDGSSCYEYVYNLIIE